MSKGIIFLAAGSAALVCGPAAAAIFGPTGPQFTASGRIVYDDNVLRLPAEAELGPGQSRDGLRYSPQIGVQYSREVGQRRLTVGGLVGYDFFQYNTYLNREHYAANGTFATPVGGRCMANLNGAYSLRQNSIGDTVNPVDPSLPPDIPPDDIGRVIDNQQRNTNFGIAANCGTGGRLGFGVSANHSSLGNAAPSRRFADSNSTVVSGYVGLGVFRPGQLQLTGAYSEINYPNRSLIPGVPLFDRNVKTYRVGFNYSRPIGNRLSGSIGVAYLAVRPASPQPAYDIPAYNVSLSYRSGPRLTFALAGSSDVLATQTVGSLYRQVNTINFNTTYRLGTSITAEANIGLVDSNYRQTFALPGEVLRGNETTTHFGGGLTYAPRPLFDVGLHAEHTVRNATPKTFDYAATRVTLALAVHF